jgi:hypothetical protein
MVCGVEGSEHSEAQGPKSRFPSSPALCREKGGTVVWGAEVLFEAVCGKFDSGASCGLERNGAENRNAENGAARISRRVMGGANGAGDGRMKNEAGGSRWRLLVN